ncbi:MAG: IspD/TarI family cytidylyltransferase, partial [bacterium]
VAIHDAARPLITIDDIRAVLEVAETTGAATLAHPVSDTIKMVEENIILDTVDRSRLWAVQTPQVFHRDIYAKAIQSAYSETATDDCALVEKSGHSVRVVPGSRINLKITYPEDKIIAEAILNHLTKGHPCG